MRMTHTSWRGLRVDHPGDWELALASKFGEPGRCAFTDRHCQRLELRWRTLRTTPNLDAMLQKHRKDEKEAEKSIPLAGQPPHWIGLVKQTEPGCIVHAGRFFEGTKTFVETTVIWPKDRDQALENSILASVACGDGPSEVRLCQAMGIKMWIPREYELRDFQADVGYVQWKFSTDKKRKKEINVERIAVPRGRLENSLDDWLSAKLDPGSQIIGSAQVGCNSHHGVHLTSIAKAPIMDRIWGLRRLQLDQAWLCDRERRLYHVACRKIGRGHEATVPESLKIECCQQECYETPEHTE